MPCWAAMPATRSAGRCGLKHWIINFIPIYRRGSRRMRASRTSIAEDSFTWWTLRSGMPDCGLRQPTSSTRPVPSDWKRRILSSRPRAGRRRCGLRTSVLQRPSLPFPSPQPHAKPSRLHSLPTAIPRHGRTLPDVRLPCRAPFWAGRKGAKGQSYRPGTGDRLRSQGFFVNFW